MAIEKREFAGRASRYNLKAFHDKIITYKSSSVGQHKSTDFLDISSTGLSFVALPEGLPKLNSRIQITFTIPDKNTMTINAQVVRTKKYKRPKWYKRYVDEVGQDVEEYFVGVNFLNIKPEEQEQLDIHLEHLIKSEQLERREQKITYVKKEFLNSYKWIILSISGIIALAISLKMYYK